MSLGGNKEYPGHTEAQWLPFSFSTSGDQTIVAAVANQTIRVIALVISAASTTNITLKDGATAKSGAMPLTGLVLDIEEKPLILTIGNAFVINSSAAVVVGGMVFVAQG